MLETGRIRIKILYLPKVIRFISGFKIVDVKAVNNAIKRWQRAWVK